MERTKASDEIKFAASKQKQDLKEEKALYREQIRPFVTLMKLTNSIINEFPGSRLCTLPKQGTMENWLQQLTSCTKQAHIVGPRSEDQVKIGQEIDQEILTKYGRKQLYDVFMHRPLLVDQTLIDAYQACMNAAPGFEVKEGILRYIQEAECYDQVAWISSTPPSRYTDIKEGIQDPVALRIMLDKLTQ